MWVYGQTEPNLFTVGHYDSKGCWCPESDHDSAEGAAARVHYLNGGSGLSVDRRMDLLEGRIDYLTNMIQNITKQQAARYSALLNLVAENREMSKRITRLELR